MLKRLLDATGIDMKDPKIQWELETDLRRMDNLRHENMPEGANAYAVTVTPSIQTYSRGLHRFRFEIQYGLMNGDRFEPLGKSALYQSETLPMI